MILKNLKIKAGSIQKEENDVKKRKEGNSGNKKRFYSPALFENHIKGGVVQ
jgi:hypothetical protein